MDRAEVTEQIAWAKRVKAAPDSKTLERLLASALIEVSEQLLERLPPDDPNVCTRCEMRWHQCLCSHDD